MARDCQEDVVESGPAKSHVVDPDLLLAEPLHDLHELVRTALRRDRHPAGALVDRCRSVGREDGRSTCQRIRLVDDHLDALASDLGLQLVGCPAGDDPSRVDDRDLVRELVRLLEILRREEQRRAFAYLRTDDIPHAEAAAWIEPRRRLVEKEDLRAADQRTGEIEPAAHST